MDLSVLDTQKGKTHWKEGSKKFANVSNIKRTLIVSFDINGVVTQPIKRVKPTVYLLILSFCFMFSTSLKFFFGSTYKKCNHIMSLSVWNAIFQGYIAPGNKLWLRLYFIFLVWNCVVLPNSLHLWVLLIYYFNAKNEWFHKFKNGKLYVEDNERNGRPNMYQDATLEHY